MRIRPGNFGDANAVASLIASFQPILTLEPSGAGAEHYLASVSEDAERQYLESPRYAYLVAELEGQMAALSPYGIRRTSSTCSSPRRISASASPARYGNRRDSSHCEPDRSLSSQ
jgi:hypothetical protein